MRITQVKIYYGKKPPLVSWLTYFHEYQQVEQPKIAARYPKEDYQNFLYRTLCFTTAYYRSKEENA